LALGATVEELQERMSSAEFTQWKAYQNLEPFGYEMENFRMGVVASTMVNVAPRKKGTKPLQPSDFYPAKKKGPIKLSPRQQKQLHEKRLREARLKATRTRKR
jgi:hypothetical protein